MQYHSIVRRAFLIGSNNSKYGRLNGVEADLERYERLLFSPNGGGWSRDEVMRLPEPSMHEFNDVISENECDYCLFIFSGHGGFDPEASDTEICINDEWEPCLEDVELPSGRQLLIIDACRSFPEPIEKMAGFGRLRIVERVSTAYLMLCRQLYEQRILNAEPGRSVMYACSPGESARETTQGGLYSRKLVEAVDKWVEHRRNYPGNDTLFVNEAFQIAQGVMPQYQHPVLENGRRKRSFPIAVYP